MIPFALTMGFIWGSLWAVFLQFTAGGRFLAARRTWITVVIGISGDVLILLVCVPVDVVIIVCGVLATSSLGIIGRSLYNEWQDEHAVAEMVDGD